MQIELIKMREIPKTELGKVINYFRNWKLSRLLLCFMHNGYLLDLGWFDTVKKNDCIDKDGKPIPWCPYPYIDFLNNHLTKEMTIFEYGSGYSTLFTADRVKDVYSVEHNQEWIDKLKDRYTKNTHIIFNELDETYEKAIQKVDGKFDMIVVDGRRRVNCVKEAVNKIKDDGIIVLDDSDREYYQEAIDILKNSGFKFIDFVGITPRAFIKRQTTIFFKRL